MQQLPNVLTAMQSIQRDSIELDELLRLEVVRSSIGVSGALEQCILINGSILEVANAYITAIPRAVRRVGAPTDSLAE